MNDTQARILLIEGNEVHARATRNCLEKWHDVVLSSSVEETLDRFVPSDFDLLIIDWRLPGESGLSFAHDLQKGLGAEDLPIMMQTSEDRAKYVREAVEAGVDDYVVKPVRCETLRERVALLLEPSPAGPQIAL
jgi:DNA-binding response OmpR family regulator